MPPADLSYNLIELALLLNLQVLSETNESQDGKDRRAQKAEDTHR